MVREHIVELKDEASLRPLRECKDTLGEPVTCVRVAPNNRKVLARTFADRVVAIDVEFFGATHNFDCGGARRHRRAPVLSEMAKHGAGGSHPLLRFASRRIRDSSSRERPTATRDSSISTSAASASHSTPRERRPESP